MKLEDLKPFCCPEALIGKLTAPFTIAGHTYATDRRILLRVPEIPGADTVMIAPLAPSQIPTNLTGFAPVAYPPGWQDFKTKRDTCERCQGKGHIRECGECKGEGVVECETCGHEETCKVCDGEGNLGSNDQGVPCDECDGRGFYEQRFWVALNRGDVVVDLHYLKLAHTLPGIVIFWKPASDRLYFTFTGGEGVIMPGRGYMGPLCNDGVPAFQQWDGVPED